MTCANDDFIRIGPPIGYGTNLPSHNSRRTDRFILDYRLESNRNSNACG